MSGEVNENQYVSYPMFNGLQKPLEFMGFQGRYITWAACEICHTSTSYADFCEKMKAKEAYFVDTLRQL